MDLFLYDNGLHHERVNRDYLFFVFHRHQRIKHKKNQKELSFFCEQPSNEMYLLPSVYTFQLD